MSHRQRAHTRLSGHRELMQRVFGDEWWHLDNDAPAPNPDWYYLERFIFAVQRALRQEQQQVEA